MRLEFADGFVTTLDLKGNPYRDLGGRLLVFENPAVDRSLVHQEHLLDQDSGVAGDITAARKVRVPLIPMEEFYLARMRGESPPEEWRNSLYLEWYSLKRGRCVLEASTFEMQVEEISWEMTEEEDQAAKKDALQALGNFMEMLGSQVASIENLGGKEVPNEFEWEKMFKHSDNLTDRYGELLEKFQDEPDAIDKHMGWDKEKREFRLSELELPDESDFEEWEEPEEHPLEISAQAVLDGATHLLGGGRWQTRAVFCHCRSAGENRRCDVDARWRRFF